MAEKYSPSTLWARYSMLKATININEGVDISQYKGLIAMMKKKSKFHVTKQAFVFEEIEIQNFIDNAPDVVWLDVKVACIFAICGACRTHELPSITVDMVAKHNDMYYISIPREMTKTYKENCFAVTGALVVIVQRYVNLRPSNVPHDRFFLNFQKGKCTTQPMGKNKFYKFPTRIAEYLNLPNAKRYTGHSFRRSSATLVANTGANLETLKRHTGHKSTVAVEKYIATSVGHKRQTGNTIASSLNCTVTSSSAGVSSEKPRDLEVVLNHSTNDEIVNPCAAGASSVRFTQHDVPLKNVSNGSDNSFANVRCDETKRRMVSDENIDPNCSSLTQSSTQNLMSKMEKFFFNKCDNLTININTKDM